MLLKYLAWICLWRLLSITPGLAFVSSDTYGEQISTEAKFVLL